MPDLAKTRSYFFLLPFVFGLLYVQYFLVRHDSIILIGTYSVIFFAYLLLVKFQDFSFKTVFILGIVVRLLLLAAIPNLSDDFYRFIWDGHLVNEGLNPFSRTPVEYMGAIARPEILTPDLYINLNSQAYFSVYPPISQFIFWIAASVGGSSVLHSVIILRIIIIFFEVGSFYFISRILVLKNLDKKNLALYAFNPLIILELTGNLHFEGILIFFILASVFFLLKEKIAFSSIFMALGISTKLIPLIFLPILLRKLSFKESSIYYVISGVIVLASFLPFINPEFINGFSGSLDLFFRKFEFNGLIFFISREIGFWYKGFDLVKDIGPWLSIASVFSILVYSLILNNRRSDVIVAMIVIIAIQLLFATTVHPWYVLPLFALSIFTNLRFPMYWSFMIFLTYIGYTADGYEHSMTILLVEYSIIVPFAIYEFYKLKRSPKTVSLG